MNKLVLGVIVIAIAGVLAVGVGCTLATAPREVTPSTPDKDTIEFVYFMKDGHEWILYDGPKVFGGIVHSPKCKCGR